MLKLGWVLQEEADAGDGDGAGGGAGPSVDQVAQEKEARLLGWQPEEEFKGPADRWKPADEFLEEGKRINGFLRKDLDKLRSAITQKDQSIAELRESIEQFAQFHQETEKRAYERAKTELGEARKAALREGDGDRVVELEERIEALGEAPQGAPGRQSAPQRKVDPVWQDWVGENAWFRNSTKMRSLANGYGDLLRAEDSTLVGRPFLDEVKRRMAIDFPEELGNGERRRAASVGEGGETRGKSGKKTYADLPAEAKAMCDKFIKQGLVASREAYVRDVFGE